MPDRAALIIAATLVPALLGACGPAPPTSPPSPPPAGLSQAMAVEAAKSGAATHQGPLTVEAVRSGTFAELGRGVALLGVASDQWVWSITLQGEFAAVCPSPRPGPRRALARRPPSPMTPC